MVWTGEIIQVHRVWSKATVWHRLSLQGFLLFQGCIWWFRWAGLQWRVLPAFSLSINLKKSYREGEMSGKPFTGGESSEITGFSVTLNPELILNMLLLNCIPKTWVVLHLRKWPWGPVVHLKPSQWLSPKTWAWTQHSKWGESWHSGPLGAQGVPSEKKTCRVGFTYLKSPFFWSSLSA